MSISYNPDRTPHSDPSLFDEARAEGMQVIEVICEEEGARAGDPTGLSFAAIVPFLPRIGERLLLQDGKVCVVRDVIWRFGEHRPSGSLLLSPFVVAYLEGGRQGGADEGEAKESNGEGKE
jgi:hypothetical protein